MKSEHKVTDHNLLQRSVCKKCESANEWFLSAEYIFSGSLPATLEIATETCFQINMVDDTGWLADTEEVEDIVSGGRGLEEIQLLEDMGPA